MNGNGGQQVPRLNLELDPELHQKLKQIAEQQERTIGAQVRQILRQYVQQWEGGSIEYRSDMSPPEE